MFQKWDAKMDQVQELLEAVPVNWGELLELFGSLDETERRRFSWVALREDDLKWLKGVLSAHQVDRLIGIGCGSGFLERVVADFVGGYQVGLNSMTRKFVKERFNFRRSCCWSGIEG